MEHDYDNMHVAFYFKLSFEMNSHIEDTAFAEVSGLNQSLETEIVQEGGENSIGHRVPKNISHQNLVCKRALQPLLNSGLSRWVESIMSGNLSEPIATYNATVFLLDLVGNPVIAWSVTGLYPVKWSLAPFDSRKNELAMETIEFDYDTIIRIM